MIVGASGLDNEIDLYDAVTTAFTTMSTGGFSPEARSIEAFAPTVQWVVTVFMIIAGLNFALMYRALAGRPRPLAKDQETHWYLAFLALATLFLSIELIRADLYGAGDSIRHAAFQATSMITTTGYASADFATWPSFALLILIGLMFLGGCTGSTSGSIKQMRVVLVGRVVRRETRLTTHPSAVEPIRLNERVVDERTLRAIIAFVMLYLTTFALGALMISIEASRTGHDVSAFGAIAAAATTLGNVGPGIESSRAHGILGAAQRPFETRHDHSDVDGTTRTPARHRPFNPLLLETLRTKTDTPQQVIPTGQHHGRQVGDGRATVLRRPGRPDRVSALARRRIPR